MKLVTEIRPSVTRPKYAAEVAGTLDELFAGSARRPAALGVRGRATLHVSDRVKKPN